jgi:hypothetical protein
MTPHSDAFAPRCTDLRSDSVLEDAFSFAILVLLAAYGGVGRGSSIITPPVTPPATKVTVTVSPVTAIAQASTSVQFSESVQNSSNNGVNWSVNSVAGGSNRLGTISASGLYTAPANVSDTTDISVAATAQAEAGASSRAIVSVFAAPRIGVRVVNGAGKFYDLVMGTKFQLRGNNYWRFTPHVLGTPLNQTAMFHSTFGPGLYDAPRVEAALTAMEQSGYNIVKAWQDCCGATQGIGNPDSPGLSASNMANVADNRPINHKRRALAVTCSQEH